MAALRRIEGGTPATEVCRKLGVSDTPPHDLLYLCCATTWQSMLCPAPGVSSGDHGGSAGARPSPCHGQDQDVYTRC